MDKKNKCSQGVITKAFSEETEPTIKLQVKISVTFMLKSERKRPDLPTLTISSGDPGHETHDFRTHLTVALFSLESSDVQSHREVPRSSWCFKSQGFN